MKKTAGFTLIELVIVIVILGILGAVAAPRFLNLQGDAYAANVNTLKGSIQSAATLASTKAILLGKDKADDATARPVTIDGNQVSFIFGYPAATNTGILEMLQDKTSFKEGTAAADTPYTIVTAADKSLTIYPSARYGVEGCKVVYENATKEKAATVTAMNTDC